MMQMKYIIYRPFINATLRSIAKPFASIIPDSYKFPVTGIIKVKAPRGESFLMHCNPTSYVAKRVFWDGMKGFEDGVTRIFVDLIKDVDVFLDVGANIGYYSLLAAALNPRLKITSFEPVPSAHKYLKDNASLNHFNNITPVQMAVSDQDGEIEFYFSKNPKFVDIVEHHLTSTGSTDKEQAHRTNLLELVRVKTTTLDGYVRQHSIPKVDLIKLDTEATEHLVLAGAQHILSEHKPIFFCEVLPGKVEALIEAAFKKHGYLMYRLDRNQAVPVSHLSHDQGTNNDHLLVHPDKLGKVQHLLK